jgi:hypothetical protein
MNQKLIVDLHWIKTGLPLVVGQLVEVVPERKESS